MRLLWSVLRIGLLGVWPALALGSNEEEGGSFERSASQIEALAEGERKPLTDREIKQILIQESIAAYPGNCPCPYSRARNGSRCGRRSAYDRAGGEEPLCFEKDVTAEMVQRYREAHAGG